MKKVKSLVCNYDSQEVETISEEFGLTTISSKILLNRGLNTFEDINQFLNPDFKYFEDATIYKDLVKGSKKIIEAVTNNKKIAIYGDYDVDGVTSISQFMILFDKVGADAIYYVPERESEGYGISAGFVEKLKDGSIDVDLLITVDCGISEIQSISEINSLGIEVIVLDHHQCTDVIPEAYAVINPKQPDCYSKNKQLCASGLSFKFLRYLNNYFKLDDIEDKMLELACLGTIADIVDLIGDNRLITYYGLKHINQTKVLGIKKLIEKANIADKTIEAFHVGYILAPRINAAGRMSTAQKAIKLMLTNDETEAEMLAEELENFNICRKQTEQEIFNEAITEIENNSLNKKSIIVVCGDNWHEGVLGIVASKVTEKYEKPSIIISVKDGIGKGSARSLSYLNIYEAIKSVDKYLVKYGGHKLAAGLTLRQEYINEFIIELNKYVSSVVGEEELLKEINVDAYIENIDVTDKLYNEMYKFEPFGHGNPKPVFALQNASIKDIKKVGKNGNHLSFNICGKNDKNISVIGFDKINLLENVLTKPKSFIVNINANEFRGNRYLQLILLNVEESEDNEFHQDEQKAKIINSLIDKSKSKIIKTDIFKLVSKLNTVYNIKTTAEEIICVLKNDINIQYVLKNEILYIKK